MKKLFLFLAVLCFSVSLFALPGFTPYFQDESGEFVYYRDYSFDRESYIGFLNYDDVSYQLRYYAPFDMEKQLPEKDISILISLNPASNFVDMTGERILTEITPDDTEYVNYLHDMVYELTSRRAKEYDVTPYNEDYKLGGNFWENGLRSYQDFEQFGGDVTILYDFYIPLFNIKKILNNKNQDMLVLATTGRILSSGDSTFNEFRGFNGGLSASSLPKSKTDGKAGYVGDQKLKKKAKKQTFTSGARELTLDENWTASAENMWWLAGRSYITVSNLPKSTMRSEIYLHYLSRRLIQSSQNTYTDFSKLELTQSNGFLSISTVIYQPAQKQNMISKKLISTDEGEYGLDYLVFSAYEKDYQANKKYFDGVLKTIK